MNPITLFPSLWHRRAASVVIVAAGVVAALLGYIFFSEGLNAETMLYEALGVTGAALLCAIVAKFPVPDRVSSWFSFLAFVFAVVGTGLGLMTDTSGNIHIIFVVALSLLSLIAGLFGPFAWIILLAVLAPYMVSHFVTAKTEDVSSTVAFVVFYFLPIISSWLLWHGGPRRVAPQATGDRAYSTLAEQLNQVSNESEIVISTIADGVMALNQKGEVQLINPAAANLLGWTQRDSLSLDYHSIIKLQDKQGSQVSDDANPLTVALRTVKPIERTDLNIQTKSGKSFQARISVTPIGTQGEGVIIVFRDITAEKAEEREQAEFISTASHEMRTPVAAIEGYMGLALNPNTATIDDKARTYLTKAHESAQHLGRLFQDLLDVSKADDGRIRNLPSVTDLAAFTGDVVNGMMTKANEKGLTLTFEPQKDAEVSERKLTPMYFADVDNDHLREVINNLVDNAIKYTKAGNVTVNVTGNNETCEITIRDSGIGIPREDIPHLFQKFYRVDNSDTREIGGTGLGLYLCRRLVEFIGGKIWVESEYGHGSTFFVSLPRMDYEKAQARLKALEEQRARQAEIEASKGESRQSAPEAQGSRRVINPLGAAPVVVPAPVQAPAPVVAQVQATAPVQAPVAAAAPAPVTTQPQAPAAAAVQPQIAPVQAPVITTSPAPQVAPPTQPLQTAAPIVGQPVVVPQRVAPAQTPTPAPSVPVQVAQLQAPVAPIAQPLTVTPVPPTPSEYAMQPEVQQQLSGQ